MAVVGFIFGLADGTIVDCEQPVRKNIIRKKIHLFFIYSPYLTNGSLNLFRTEKKPGETEKIISLVSRGVMCLKYAFTSNTEPILCRQISYVKA